MNLDNLNKRQEASVFKQYTRLSQSVNRTNTLLSSSRGDRWSVWSNEYVRTRQLLPVAPTYTPIHGSDMCLEDYLKSVNSKRSHTSHAHYK